MSNDPPDYATLVAIGAGYDYIATEQTFSLGTFGNPATVGPVVSLVTGADVMVFISFRAQRSDGISGNTMIASAAVSGATVVAPADARSVSGAGRLNTVPGVYSGFYKMTGLTPGTNVFTLQYRVDGGTWLVRQRGLLVLPL